MSEQFIERDVEPINEINCIKYIFGTTDLAKMDRGLLSTNLNDLNVPTHLHSAFKIQFDNVVSSWAGKLFAEAGTVFSNFHNPQQSGLLVIHTLVGYYTIDFERQSVVRQII